MTRQLHRSEIAVRAAHVVSSDSLKPLALAGLILAASLVLQTASDAYGETVTKPQVEVKAAVKKADRNAGFHLEGIKGAGLSSFRDDGEQVRKICKHIGGTYNVFNGEPICHKN